MGAAEVITGARLRRRVDAGIAQRSSELIRSYWVKRTGTGRPVAEMYFFSTISTSASLKPGLDTDRARI